MTDKYTIVLTSSSCGLNLGTKKKEIWQVFSNLQGRWMYLPSFVRIIEKVTAFGCNLQPIWATVWLRK